MIPPPTRNPPPLSYATPVERTPSPPWWMWLSAAVILVICGGAIARLIWLAEQNGDATLLLPALVPLALICAEWMLLWRGSTLGAVIILLVSGISLALIGIAFGVMVISSLDENVRQGRPLNLEPIGACAVDLGIAAYVFVTHAGYVERVQDWRHGRPRTS